VTVETALLAHCRAGFEPEAAADLARIAAAARAGIDVDAPPGRGFVVGRVAPFERTRIGKALAGTAPIFVRSLFVGSGPHPLFDPRASRAAPIASRRWSR